MFYPSATFNIFTNPNNGLPVFESELGLMVHTAVEADGITYEDWLPVMDYANRSMKSVPYSIQVYDKATKQYVERRVEAATTFDVNAAIQRSLVRATARHGLGLYIYNGLDHLNEEPNKIPLSQRDSKHPSNLLSRNRKFNSSLRSVSYTHLRAHET